MTKVNEERAARVLHRNSEKKPVVDFLLKIYAKILFSRFCKVGFVATIIDPLSSSNLTIHWSGFISLSTSTVFGKAVFLTTKVMLARQRARSQRPICPSKSRRSHRLTNRKFDTSAAQTRASPPAEHASRIGRLALIASRRLDLPAPTPASFLQIIRPFEFQ